MSAWFARKRKLLIDIAERAFWTGVQSSLGMLTTALTDIPVQYTIPAAIVLAVIKGGVASHIGDDTSAAAMPGSAK